MRTSKPEKNEAFKLFSKGLTPIEVYESLNKSVNQVTVYRWYKEYQKKNQCVTLEVNEVLNVIKNDYDDLKSRLNHDQISTLSIKDKKLIHNTNTYIELNIENSVNYGLDTDK